MTPESAIDSQKLISDIYKLHGISIIAIDESHCVSLWGNSFRSSYLQLSCIKKWLPKTPILALTGTATKKVQENIIEVLGLSDPKIIKTDIDRQNLSYYVHPANDPIKDIYNLITNGSSIIYCQTREKTEQIAALIQKNGLSCEAYHSGIHPDKKSQIHQKFLSDEIKCIVATISFGMGINKKNIHTIIHYGCPKDIESYCQETGRAGRDGHPSQCHIFYSESDFIINRHFLKNIIDPNLKNHHEQMVSVMEKYLYSTTCRRKFILDYFESTDYIKCNVKTCCDNCSNTDLITKIDITTEVKLFLELLKDFPDRFGKSKLIMTIIGTKNKTLPHCLISHPHFGSHQTHNSEWWNICLQYLSNHQLINQKMIDSGFGSTLSLTHEGIQWINSPLSHFLIDNRQIDKKSHNKTKSSCGQTIKETHSLISQGLPLQKIAEKRNLSQSTIENHVAQILLNNEFINIDLIGLDAHKYHEIKYVIENDFKGHPDKLTPIKNLCDPKISYFNIKCVVSILQSNIVMQNYFGPCKEFK